jgi:hypothetical protein
MRNRNYWTGVAVDDQEVEVRAQGWGKTTTVKILEDINKARANARKIYPTYVTENELEFLKSVNPSMSDWYDRNTVTMMPTMSYSFNFEVITDDQENLRAMFIGEDNGSIKKSTPAFNREDRRRLRKRKTR